MIDLKELRELAIGSIEAEEHTNRLQDSGVYHVHTTTLQAIEKAHKDFVFQCTPETVIELLDRIEAAEKVCDAAAFVERCLTNKYRDESEDFRVLEEITHALQQYQEVRQCADQQQKK